MDFSMDFVTRLLISTNLKGNSYDAIPVIIDWLMNMIYYKPVIVTIDAMMLVEVILDMVVWHHNLPNSIVFYRSLLFTLKFWFSFYYFLKIKR